LASDEVTSPDRPERVTLEVGHIAKAHGIRGEVIVDLITDRLERLAPGAVLETIRGLLTVRSSAPHQHRWRVQFDGVSDRTAAEALHGLVLRAEPLADDSGELWVHELIGCAVVSRDGTTHGTVASVEANAASDLLVLDDGRMVPIVFVDRVEDRVILIDPPPGLLDDDSA
jgi:16S rRNA processing protein RimM